MIASLVVVPEISPSVSHADFISLEIISIVVELKILMALFIEFSAFFIHSMWRVLVKYILLLSILWLMVELKMSCLRASMFSPVLAEMLMEEIATSLALLAMTEEVVLSKLVLVLLLVAGFSG